MAVSALEAWKGSEALLSSVWTQAAEEHPRNPPERHTGRTQKGGMSMWIAAVVVCGADTTPTWVRGVLVKSATVEPRM